MIESPSRAPAGPLRLRTRRIGLVGNPNTGKSSLFNRLTGLRQRTANYPGITVERKSGTAFVGDEPVEVVDLPGAYSLSASSPDERVVVDCLCGREELTCIDLIVCVVDATQLDQSLLLPLQVADFGLPQILVLNQWDRVRKQKLAIDVAELSRRLSIPVIPISATTGEGLEDLRLALAAALGGAGTFLPPTQWPACVDEALGYLGEAAPGVDRGRLLRVLFDCQSAVLAALDEEFPRLSEARCLGRETLRKGGFNPGPAEAVIQHRRIRSILDGVIASPEANSGGETVDRILLHRFWGLAVFFGVMWVVFQSVYAWAVPLMDLIETGTDSLGAWVEPLLAGMPLLQSLVVEGLIAGVGGVVVFLPQILILFLFIGILEESGYMARAAFLMDRMLGWCGLNGKSFVPLLSSFACAVPGVLAARTLESRRERISTVLMAPFMSCSARLPVYVLLIGAFIEPRYGAFVAGFTLFAAHFIGLLTALPLAWLANRVLIRSRPVPFILEMPAYRAPNPRNLALRVWLSGKAFLVRAGTVILAFSVIIWALLYFPRDPVVEAAAEAAFLAEIAEPGESPEATSARIEASEELAAARDNRIRSAWTEDSYLGRFGRVAQPVFDPAGFDWKITVGVLSSFPAREVIIATMGILYSLGDEVDEDSAELRDKIAAETWANGPRSGTPVYSLPVVLAMMVFFALCAQCAATLTAIGKEIGWSWAIGSFIGMTSLAWLGAVSVYQIGSLLG